MIKAKGFTLIELLIIVAIVSLLSLSAFMLFNNVRAKSRNSFRQATLKQIKLAFNMYYDDTGTWPSSNGTCLGYNDGQTCWIGPTGNTTLNNALKTYIGEIPKDPSYQSRTIGNAFVYFNKLPTWHCSGTIFPFPSGPYVAWQPDKPLASGDSADSRCLGLGFMSCCDFNCANGYYCVYSLQ